MSNLSKAVKDGRHFLTQFRSLVEFCKVLEDCRDLEVEVEGLRSERVELVEKTTVAEGELAAILEKKAVAEAALKAAEEEAKNIVKEARRNAAKHIDSAHQKTIADEAAAARAAAELAEQQAAATARHEAELEKLAKEIEALEAQRDTVKTELKRLKEKFD